MKLFSIYTWAILKVNEIRQNFRNSDNHSFLNKILAPEVFDYEDYKSES